MTSREEVGARWGKEEEAENIGLFCSVFVIDGNFSITS
jgi:hypothetical protein